MTKGKKAKPNSRRGKRPTYQATIRFKNLSSTAAAAIATPVSAITTAANAGIVGSHLLGAQGNDSFLQKLIEWLTKIAAGTPFETIIKQLSAFVLSHTDQCVGAAAIGLAVGLSYGRRDYLWPIIATALVFILPVFPVTTYLWAAVGLFAYHLAANNYTRFLVCVGLAFYLFYFIQPGIDQQPSTVKPQHP